MVKPRLQYLKITSPVGPFFIVFVPSEPGGEGTETVLASGFGSLTAVKELLPTTNHDFRISPASPSHPYRGWLHDYFSGNTQVLRKIPLDMTGTPFQRRVWKALRAIPYGKTISYATLAEKTGEPKAVRAVGSACKANRQILFTPCHRVIKGDGSLGDYRFGSEIKKRLLKLEQTLKRNSKQ